MVGDLGLGAEPFAFFGICTGAFLAPEFSQFSLRCLNWLKLYFYSLLNGTNEDVFSSTR